MRVWGYNLAMDKRLLVGVATLGVAVVAVGLSAAAIKPSGGGDSSRQQKGQSVTPAKTTTAKQATTPNGVGSSPAETRGAADYWTPERMRTARPMEQTVPGATDSGSPSPSVKTSPASEPSGRQAKKKITAKRARAAAPENGVSSGPASGQPGYWTEGRMDNAKPTDMGVPGGDSAEGSSDPGVSVQPGS